MTCPQKLWYIQSRNTTFPTVNFQNPFSELILTNSLLHRFENFPGILLAVRLLVSRAGAFQSPISPTYQQAVAKMKEKMERCRVFLLLLFLADGKALEIRHGAVVALNFVDETLVPPLARGHCGRLSSSTPSSRRVHYSLICESAHLDGERAGNDLATRVGTPEVHQRGASGPMPERWSI